jgi:hypothetical protein
MISLLAAGKEAADWSHGNQSSINEAVDWHSVISHYKLLNYPMINH